MVYAHAVNRVTFSGTCFGGAEEWSTGFWMGSEGADAGDPNGAAIAIAGHWATFFQNATTSISSSYITTQVKVAQHNAEDGKTDLSKVDFYDVSPTISGGGISSTLPAQISLVGTLTSEFQRGTAAKGRMYLPGVNAVASGTGKISSTVPTAISTNMKTMFDGINADANVPDSVILVSRGTKTTIFPGPEIIYINPRNALVTGLRVGDVYDTQRRRRNGLTETYTTRVLA